MNTVEKNRLKNIPLATTEDRTDFVSWSMSVPDGSISAGWQSLHPRLADVVPAHVLRTSGAKLVSLARRELNQTPDQIAIAAGVPLSEVVALEHGDDVAAETISRVAGVLRLSADVLAQLFGFTQVLDSQLIEAATEFVVHLEPAEPLQPREMQALIKFRNAVQSGRGRMHVG